MEPSLDGLAMSIATRMAIGQSAGTAAALAVLEDVLPRESDVARLRQLLTAQGGVLQASRSALDAEDDIWS